MDDPERLSALVKHTHTLLLAADEAYAYNRTQQTNTAVVRAQQPYYAALGHYWRATLPYPTYLVRRANLLWRRAKQNRRRLPDDPLWQMLTLHQYRRTRAILTRAQAIAEWECEHVQPTASTPSPKPAKRPRIKHPITGRTVYADTMTKD